MPLTKIFEILLYPEGFYKRITNKKLSLVIGIIIVGIIDLAFPFYFAFSDFLKVLVDKLPIVILSIALLGIIDVLFLAIPLYDLFKFISAKIKLANSENNLIKIMKIYIYSHFIITPVNIAFYLLIQFTSPSVNQIFIILLSLLGLVIMFWGAAIVTKGIYIVYGFDKIYSKLLFIVVFTWEYLLGSALSYIINNWILRLFTIF